MPQGPGPLRQILMPPPNDGPRMPLDPTPLAQTNPGLARLVDFFGGLTGLKDALVPESSNATVAGAGLGAALPLMGVLGSLKRVGQPITAYHGSPHDFDKFSLSKIGTGEGAQAYGHGLYFAENQGVANQYKKDLTAMRVSSAQRTLNDMGGDLDAAISKTHSEIDRLKNLPNAGGDAAKRDRFVQLQEEKLSELNLLKNSGEMSKGRMYEVGLHASPEDFLDWDKPLSQQPKIQAALEKAGVFTGKKKFDEWEALVGPGGVYVNPNDSAQKAYVAASTQLGPEKATELFRSAGIKGIRYLDQGSRAKGEGSSNFVVFDDDIIEIKKKLALLLAAGAGTAAATQKDRK